MLLIYYQLARLALARVARSMPRCFDEIMVWCFYFSERVRTHRYICNLQFTFIHYSSTTAPEHREGISSRNRGPPMVVIVGGGITGSCVAYYLTNLANGSVPVTLIDAVKDPAATGCSCGAGAFLSESWGDGTRTEPLHRKSFQLHCDLAQDLNLENYRELPVFSVNLDEVNQHDADGATSGRIPWLGNMSHAPLPGRSAQVDPSELVKSLLNYSFDNGATSLTGSVVGVNIDDGTITSVSIRMDSSDELEVPIDNDIVFTTGAWASNLESWIGIPTPIEGVWSTSLIWNEGIVDRTLAESPAALFCREDINGCHLEILPRPNGSLYVSGCGGSKVLSPATMRSETKCPKPGQTNKPDPSRVSAARASIGKTNILLNADCKPDIEQACIRPVSPDAAPIVGRVPGTKNAFIATGGGPWGITWGPVIGQSIARLILDRELSINLRNFSPRRFDTPVYRTLLRQRGKQASGKPIGEQW